MWIQYYWWDEKKYEKSRNNNNVMKDEEEIIWWKWGDLLALFLHTHGKFQMWESD